MSATVNKRRHIRFTTTLNAHCSSDPGEGIGVLANISYCGALVEDSSIKPSVGSMVRVYVFVEPVDPITPASPYELVGRVVRHSSSGFAIDYKDDDPEVRQLVNEAGDSQN